MVLLETRSNPTRVHVTILASDVEGQTSEMLILKGYDSVNVAMSGKC